MTQDPGAGPERRDPVPTPERLTSAEAVVADGELTPPEKLDLLKAWDARHGTQREAGHARIADAADLGFADPAPYSAEVQRAMVELYRRHHADLPPPEAGAQAAHGRDTPNSPS